MYGGCAVGSSSAHTFSLTDYDTLHLEVSIKNLNVSTHWSEFCWWCWRCNLVVAWFSLIHERPTFDHINVVLVFWIGVWGFCQLTTKVNYELWSVWVRIVHDIVVKNVLEISGGFRRTSTLWITSYLQPLVQIPRFSSERFKPILDSWHWPVLPSWIHVLTIESTQCICFIQEMIMWLTDPVRSLISHLESYSGSYIQSWETRYWYMKYLLLDSLALEISNNRRRQMKMAL